MNLATATVPAVQPVAEGHPLTFEGGVWVCPVTGYRIHKRIAANLAQRRAVLARAQSDIAVQRVLWEKCATSWGVWVNLFAWTYRQHATLPDGTQRPVTIAHVPMITWPVQDFAAGRIIAAIREGRDILIDKSRDMGASWLCLLVLLWFWLFEADSAFKVLSRKEEEVDSPDDPSCLFWKLRYVLQRLPAWMLPPHSDKRMNLPNAANGSSIKGESTNDHAGRGGRLKAAMLDECAAYENLDAIERAMHQSTTCRIYNSTPIGPGAYSDRRFSGKIEVVVLGFWDHPEKGRGRRTVVEKGRLRWTSPWREAQKSQFDDRTIAQNIDIDHERAGSMFFDSGTLTQHAQMHGREAPVVGSVLCRQDGEARDSLLRRWAIGEIANDAPPSWVFTTKRGTELRVWCPLSRAGPGAILRPSQARDWVGGWDISMGTGASETAGVFFDADTGEQAAEWASASVDPAEAARIAAGLGWWFGGRRGMAFLAWESNGGGGQIFSRVMRGLMYPWIYRHVRRVNTAVQVTDRVGWWNNRESNLDTLGGLRDDVAMGRCTLHSRETVGQMGRYVFYPDGNVGPAGLEAQTGDVRAAHGDRARAAAVAWEARLRLPRVAVDPRKARPGTYGHLLEQAEQEREEGAEDE